MKIRNQLFVILLSLSVIMTSIPGLYLVASAGDTQSEVQAVTDAKALINAELGKLKTEGTNIIKIANPVQVGIPGRTSTDNVFDIFPYADYIINNEIGLQTEMKLGGDSTINYAVGKFDVEDGAGNPVNIWEDGLSYNTEYTLHTRYEWGIDEKYEGTIEGGDVTIKLELVDVSGNTAEIAQIQNVVQQ